MELINSSLVDGDTAPDLCALAVPADLGPVDFAVNKNPDLEESMEGHGLDSASSTGLSSLNPRVR